MIIERLAREKQHVVRVDDGEELACELNTAKYAGKGLKEMFDKAVLVVMRPSKPVLVKKRG